MTCTKCTFVDVFSIGDEVEHIFTNRTGYIVDRDADLAFVLWLNESDGERINPPKGRRTWVTVHNLLHH